MTTVMQPEPDTSLLSVVESINKELEEKGKNPICSIRFVMIMAAGSDRCHVSCVSIQIISRINQFSDDFMHIC